MYALSTTSTSYVPLIKLLLEVASRVDVPLLFFLYSLAGKLFLRFTYICSCRLSSVESTKFLAVISNVVCELVVPKLVMSKDTDILKPMLLSSKTIVSLLLLSVKTPPVLTHFVPIVNAISQNPLLLNFQIIY